MILHPNISVTGGDDWALNATLLTPDLEPIDLSRGRSPRFRACVRLSRRGVRHLGLPMHIDFLE
jgi:hypothetical protein